MKTNCFSVALKMTLPVFFGYIAIGIPFGLMVVNSGYPWWVSLLMSTFMYTGAGQYFAIALFAAGSPLYLVVLSEFLLSIRHFFYSVALIQKYRGTGFYKPYMIFSITDETFAVVSNAKIPEGTDKGKLYFLVSLLDQIYWITGSVIGAVAFKLLEKYNLSQYLTGIDFALTALFIVILIEQVKSTKDFISPGLGIIAGVLLVILYKAGLISSSNILWIAIVVALALLILLRAPKFYREEIKNADKKANKAEEK